MNINTQPEKSDYSGRFAPLDDGFEKVVSRNARKRMRHSTGATSASPPTHLSQQQNDVPTKEVFSNMNVEEKLDTMFGIMTNIQQTSLQVNQLNSFCYLQHSVNEVNEARMRLLEYKSLQLETKSLRSNLIINGIPEDQLEDIDTIYNKVTNFIEKYFQITSVALVDAYRVGRRNIGRRAGSSTPRPILVTFLDQRNANSIMANVRDLKGTRFGVSRDYPREIREARKQLWPEFKEARDRYGFRNVQLLFPAAIKVNGDVVKDLFPGWYSVLQGSRNSNVQQRVAERHRHNVGSVTNNVHTNIQEPTVIPSIITPPQRSIPEYQPPLTDSDTESEREMMTDPPTHTATSASTVSSQPGYLLSVHPPISNPSTSATYAATVAATAATTAATADATTGTVKDANRTNPDTVTNSVDTGK